MKIYRSVIIGQQTFSECMPKTLSLLNSSLFSLSATVEPSFNHLNDCQLVWTMNCFEEEELYLHGMVDLCKITNVGRKLLSSYKNIFIYTDGILIDGIKGRHPIDSVAMIIVLQLQSIKMIIN